MGSGPADPEPVLSFPVQDGTHEDLFDAVQQLLSQVGVLSSSRVLELCGWG